MEPSPLPSLEQRMQARVRYCDVDRMGYLWHGHYLALFEEGRTDWLRARGESYRLFEEAGALLVVVESGVRHLKPAGYEDELTIVTRLAEAEGVRLSFEYEVLRENRRLATGFTRLACVDRAGKPRRLPDDLLRLLTLPIAGRGTSDAPPSVQGTAGGGTS